MQLYKIRQGLGAAPITSASWIYNQWKPPSKNPGYTPGISNTNSFTQTKHVSVHFK